MILGVTLRSLTQRKPFGRTVRLLAVEDYDGIVLVVTGLPFVRSVLFLDSSSRRDREA